MKIGAKRRRTKQELLDVKEEERIKEESIQQKLSQFDEMQKKIADLQAEVNNNSAAANIVGGLLEKGELVQDA